ncbi:MAG TPA: TspO/MBR family protein [Candidatus Sericytochromatia bacterium]
MIRAWMVIGVITLLVALGSAFIRPRDIPWIKRLDRPKWLFFEPAIPFIWTVVFVCGALSATLIWEQQPGSLITWLIMGLYLLLEIITVAYIPATVRLHSLTVGTVLGGLGVIFGILLTLTILPMSEHAALLLLPYLVWTPIGTYTTMQMIDLNPNAA